jgi:ribosome-binding factor A
MLYRTRKKRLIDVPRKIFVLRETFIRNLDMKSKRGQRLNSEFRKNIYDVIKYDLNNPLITEMFSVTKADVSKDLKNAKVFISVFSTNKEKAKTTFDAIVADAKKIRYELAHSTELLPALCIVGQFMYLFQLVECIWLSAFGSSFFNFILMQNY